MTIRSIDHVQLSYPVGDTAAVRHFYAELIGLAEVAGHPGSLRFRAGSQRIDLVATENRVSAPATAHLAFETTELIALRNRLLGAGLEIDEKRPLAHYLRFYVDDPAGNSLEFLQPDPSQTSTV